MRTRLAFAFLIALVALQGRTVSEADGVPSTPVSVAIDVDTGQAGIQNYRIASPSATFTAAVVVSNVSNLQAFNFEIAYAQALISSPTIAMGSDLDRNPDANQAALTATGRSWSCSPPAPSGDADPSSTVGATFISCYSSGAPAGPTFGTTGTVVASVEFTVLAAGGASLDLRNVNTFKAGGVETGSCNTTVILAAKCRSAFVDQNADGDGIPDGYETATPCLSPSVNNASGDADGDGATNLAEFNAVSEPCVYDTDRDGCRDGRELQTAVGSQTSGGRRDPTNPWDYFNPTHDHLNRVDDILAVVGYYFKDKGLITYSPDYDRTLLGPDLWNLGPPNGLQRVDDILNSVRQYFHDCS